MGHSVTPWHLLWDPKVPGRLPAWAGVGEFIPGARGTLGTGWAWRGCVGVSVCVCVHTSVHVQEGVHMCGHL